MWIDKIHSYDIQIRAPIIIQPQKMNSSSIDLIVTSLMIAPESSNNVNTSFLNVVLRVE